MPRTPIKRGDKGMLIGDQLAMITQNEIGSFTGPGRDDAAKTLLHAIMNGDETLGKHRPVTAKDHWLHVPSPKEEANLADIRNRLLPEERSLSIDRAARSRNFNFRNVRDYGGDPGQMLSSIWKHSGTAPWFIIGPFDNSFPTSHFKRDGLDAEGVYLNLY